MRTRVLLLAGFLAGYVGRCGVERITSDEAAAPAPSPPPSVVTDAGVELIDSPPFAAFPARRLPDGTFLEVASDVWFIAPPGFIATRPETRALQLSVPETNIVISVSTGARLYALKPARESIQDFATTRSA